jgi:hypothetical protein
MRVVMISTMLATGLATGLLLACGDGAFGQTNPPAPVASAGQTTAKIQDGKGGLDDGRRPYVLAGSGQRALVLMHGWGSTYAPKRPEEIPALAAPDVPTTGFYPWAKSLEPRTWPILSFQSPCWKC